MFFKTTPNQIQNHIRSKYSVLPSHRDEHTLQYTSNMQYNQSNIITTRHFSYGFVHNYRQVLLPYYSPFIIFIYRHMF